MLWLEMSREFTHGGGGWGFARSLWSPTHKRNSGSHWAFWESLLEVRAGDTILHLREDKETAFVGYSIADTDGFKTAERPPEPGQWGYDEYFYRVSLRDFVPFPTPIKLRMVFAQQGAELRRYFETNKNKPKKLKKRLFYVIQAGRLQCLNGAYLSEVDEELEEILFGIGHSVNSDNRPPSLLTDIRTGETVRSFRARVRQKDFSDKVRTNYGHSCCFPGCEVAEGRFLIGSHIARWADVPELRGNLSNGFCFCLMHDKAFEDGLFTVDRFLQVLVNKASEKVKASEWCRAHLLPFDGLPIRRGRILPSVDALAHHWERIGISLSNEDNQVVDNVLVSY